MSRWRELARQLRAQDGVRASADIRDEAPPAAAIVPIVPNVPKAISQFAPTIDPAQSPPIVPNVPNVPRAVSPFPPCADPAVWPSVLAALDTSRPPDGIEPDRWPMVLADAQWIARTHGDNAAAFGWTASDLFGLSDYPGAGGLADRLEGARRLAFTSSVAHWRSEDCEGWLWRRTLTAKPVLWEA
jgi:hypothetical protein